MPLPEPGWLAALVGALDADAVALALRLAHAASPTARSTPPATPSTCAAAAATTAASHEPDGPRFDEPRIVFGACAGAALYRRSLFADIGLFDERFFLSWEDVDLDLRAALAGHRCLYVPDAVVHHSAGRVVRCVDRLALERRNKAWLALQRPAAAAAGALPRARAGCARPTRRAPRGEGPRGWLARVAPFVREAPRAARWRSTVTRRVPVRTLLPLLLSESQPYSRTGASSSRQNARNASASRDGSREAGRTST